MGRGNKCPNSDCGRMTLRYRKGAWSCSSCKAVAWWISTEVRPGRQGRGFNCPTCKNGTLFDVAKRKAGKGRSLHFYRCATCYLALVVPLSSE